MGNYKRVSIILFTMHRLLLFDQLFFYGITEKEQRPFYTSDIVMKICEKLDLDY